MRALKWTVMGLAVIVVVTGVVLFVSSIGVNDAPVINCSIPNDEMIKATVDVTDEELLKLVTAADKQDGDLTEKITLVRKKTFIDDKTSMITFSVCDSDNNVTALKKKIYFEDYRSPEFEFSLDFIFPSGKYYGKLSSYATATDMFDGDLTRNIKTISSEFDNVVGTYPINMKVSNSMGDTEEITINGIVIDDYNYDIRVHLKEHVFYFDADEEPDWMSFIESVQGKGYSLDDVVVDASKVDLATPGVYDVFYTINEGDKRITISRLVVVVREVD